MIKASELIERLKKEDPNSIIVIDSGNEKPEFLKYVNLFEDPDQDQEDEKIILLSSFS